MSFSKVSISLARSSDTHTHRNKSYLLALGYTEQLSAATHTMFTLGTLAADWGANMVEPFVKKSFLFGLQNVMPPEFKAINDKDMLRLFEVYDQARVNQELHEKTSPQVTMTDFDTFLAEAPPNVTLFHFTTMSSKYSPKKFALDSKETQLLEKELAKEPTDHVLQCLSLGLSGLRRIEKDIDKELNSKRMMLFKRANKRAPVSEMAEFKINNVWCLNSRQVYRSDTLGKYVPPHSTVIFTNWRGCGVRPCSYRDRRANTPIEWRDKFRYAILTENRTLQRLNNQHVLHHSSIEENARLFLKKLGYSSPFVSIHVRIERVVQQSKETKDPASYIKQCLDEFTAAIQSLAQTKGESPKTLMITDVGSKYGTSTCQKGKKCKLQESKQVLSQLNRLGFHPQSYDPHVMNMTQNNGYVSLVEMHMLAAGDKLVMMGFGGFQAILENLFLSYGHSKQDVIHICHAH